MLVANQFLDTADVLNLRRVNRHVSGAALSVLQNRFTKVYVELSSTSLRCFEEICSRSPYAEHITEVIYVALIRKPLDRISHNVGIDELHDIYDRTDSAAHKALEKYENLLQTQDDILKHGKLAEKLATCLQSLPKLKIISFEGVPEEMKPPPTCNLLGQRPTPVALNKNSLWTRCVDAYTPLRLRAVSKEQLAYDNILSMVLKFYSAQSIDTFATVIRAMNACRSDGVRKNLELRLFRVPSTVLDATSVGLNSLSRVMIESAMSNITSITFYIDRFANHGNPGNAVDYLVKDEAIIEKRVKVLQAATRLKTIAIYGVDRHSRAVMGNILNKCTWPELESFETWNYVRFVNEPDEPPDEAPDASTSAPRRNDIDDRSVAEFLLRHRRSLRKLYLRKVVGLHPMGYTSTRSLAVFLKTVQGQFPKLDIAHVTASLWVGKSRQALETEEVLDSKWWEKQRSLEMKSAIGRIARHYDIEPTESAENLHEVDYFDRYMRSEDWNPKFCYDFGPVLLGEDAKKNSKCKAVAKCPCGYMLWSEYVENRD